MRRAHLQVDLCERSSNGRSAHRRGGVVRDDGGRLDGGYGVADVTRIDANHRYTMTFGAHAAHLVQGRLLLRQTGHDCDVDVTVERAVTAGCRRLARAEPVGVVATDEIVPRSAQRVRDLDAE